MDLQRSNSDAIEKSFHDSFQDGDTSFLLDTNELQLDDVLRLGTETSDGAETQEPSALQDSLLTLETGGLAEDEWLVASPSEAPEERPKGSVEPGENFRNPRDAILSSAPSERLSNHARADLQPAVERRKRSISSPEPAGSAPVAQAQWGRRGVGSNADGPVQPKEGQASMPEIKTSNPGTLGALESFTPSPPRLSVLPAADRWGDSKIPRSPLAKSPAASSTNGFGANAGSAKGNSPSKLPSPGAIPPSPKRVMTPGASSLNRSASPLGESRIPKPRAGAQASGTAAPETRKQRYVPRATPERSSQSGSSSGGRSGGRPRSAKPKPKLTDLEKGWVGNDVPIEDNAEDGTFAGDEALKVAEELSAPSETKAGVMGVAESGLTKPNQEGNTTNLEANASSSKVDACTQVTPKLGDMTNGPAEQNSPAQKAQACACCDIM